MYSQRDPAWMNVYLGGGDSTIGEEGCLLTCVAYVLNHRGYLVDPAILNRYLSRHQGYLDDGRLIYKALQPLGLVLRNLYHAVNQPCPGACLAEAGSNVHHVFVAVNYRPYAEGYNEHWVYLAWGYEDDYEILDPYPYPTVHRKLSLLATYAQPEWDLSRAVYKLAIFDYVKPDQYVLRRRYV